MKFQGNELRFCKLTLWSLLIFAANAFALPPVTPFSQQPLTPLYAAHAPQTTDHFYTVSAEDYQAATTIHGFQAVGIAAYLESAPLPNSGQAPAPNTLPFMRFYSPTRTDHFYTTSETEAAYVLANGWQFEKVEGYIYATQVPGSLPLHRLNRTGESGDHDHYYTLNASDIFLYTFYMGWQYDGVAGYAYATAMPTVQNGLVFGYRPWLPEPQPSQLAYPIRAKYFGQIYILYVERIKKKTSRQVVSFSLTSYGMQASRDHFGVMLRAKYNESVPLENGFYYWGAGAAIGNLGFFCGGTSLLALIEIFDLPGAVFGPGSSPNTCSSPMLDGTRYDVEVRVSDTAQVEYRIRLNGLDIGFGSVNIASLQGWTPGSGYKLAESGVVITPGAVLDGTTGTYTAYIENLSVRWD